MTKDGPEGFDRAVEHLEPYGTALVGLIRELLREADVHVHTVNFRVKERSSATKKIVGAGEKYAEFSDLHDLLGVRVITYFADEVDAVASALTPEIDVDEDNSVDKRAALDPDRFGYLSLHFVAKLTQTRADLVEYKRFADRPFELQIRSILQHAWAEIEHDLGYKAGGTPPRDVKRRFSRLAGLLELADDEFGRLRDDLASYEKVVDERITEEPAVLEIDQSTITALISSGALNELGERIARLYPAPLAKGANRASASRYAGQLQALGVPNIDTVLKLCDGWSAHVLRFAELFIGDLSGTIVRDSVDGGIVLLYLIYALVGASDPSVAALWTRTRKFRNEAQVLNKIADAWAAVVDELGAPPIPPPGSAPAAEQPSADS